MPGHDQLVLWTQLATLLVLARLLGVLAGRIRQPAVAGELAAGLILGPSVFGHVWPSGFGWTFPSGSGGTALSAVATICLAGLLLSIGSETDLALLRRLGRAATSVSTISFVVPLAAGVGLAVMLPASLLGKHGGRAPFVILVGGAVAISSLPVIAKIVSDLGLIRRNIGQLAIAAGTVQDAAGFVMVAIATGLAGSHGGSVSRVAEALAGVAGITVVTLTVGQRVLDYSLRRARRSGPNVVSSLSVCFGGAVVAAAGMQAFGVEGALGAFVAGVALGRSRFQLGRATSLLQTLTTTLFAPLYFSTAGLRVDLSVLSDSTVLVVFLVLLATAVVAKVIGAAAGGLVARLPGREVLGLCAALQGRGALQVVLATAGLSLGVLTTASYTVLILMSLICSLAVPPVLRLALAGWAGSEEEQERLEREERLEHNMLVRGDRLLLASRGRPGSVLTAEVLAASWPAETPVTVLGLLGEEDEGTDRPAALQATLAAFPGRELEYRPLGSGWTVQDVLAEANLGYGAIGVSASEDPSAGHLLSPVLDELVMHSPLPLVIVKRGTRGQPLASCRTILAPVSGTPSSRAGQEVACNLTAALGARLVLAHAVTRSDAPESAVRGRRSVRTGAAAGNAGTLVQTARQGEAPPAPGRRRLERADGAADVVLRSAWESAVEMGAEAEVLVHHGTSAGHAVLAAAEEVGADLIAVGTSVRHVDGRPFLGHTVEQILARSPATVVVVALPDRSSQMGAAIIEAEPV